jgi:polysaccharide pyruvyl transferase WcaK-like protein
MGALQATISRLHRQGHEIVLMSAFPADDRWLIQLMQEAEVADAIYVPGYADLDETLRWLASAELVIGERLHASILAAATTTPFVALEYRPKIRDFAKSIDAEEQVVRTDELQNLDGAVSAALQRTDELRTQLTRAVAQIRDHQKDVADRLSADLKSLLR